MTIGSLYDANNVVVGQAAVLVAPNGTALPSFLALNQADPFDITAYISQVLTIAATATWTLSYNGVATSSLTQTSTAASIQTALNAVITPFVSDGAATVTGTTGGPYTITLNEAANELSSITALATIGTAVLAGGLWTPVGATDQGWKYNANKSTQTISIEEQSSPAGMSISSQAVTIEGSLSEDISRTLVLAYNATLARTAAAVGNPGYDTISLTDDVQYYAVALITSHYNGRPRIVYAPKWSQLANTSTDFRRAANKRMYPVSFATVCATNLIQVVNFTASHL